MSETRQNEPLPLVARTVSVRNLDDTTRAAMWALFEGYYEGVTRARFEEDLAEKNDVILLRDPRDGSLQGFSTLMVYPSTVQGRRFVTLFSGDTLIAPGYWGQTALQRAFLAYGMKTKLRHPLVPVYWFLISKGYKTYLLLSRNFPEYWPRYDRPTPPWHRAVIDYLSREKFGAAWQPEDGVLRFPHDEGRLREDVAPVDPALMAMPDVRFFVEKNPGHTRGDELCCIGRIDLALATSYLTKLARRKVGARGLSRARWTGSGSR